MKQRILIMETNSQRVQSMDLLRVLACLGVIVVHIYSSSLSMGYIERGTNQYLYCYSFLGLFPWAIPIFAMITGYFFLNPQKDYPLKKLYGKKILRLVLSLIFWTCFYAAILRSLNLRYYPFGKNNDNFWYISTCIGLYISMPVLRGIAADDKKLAYFCWIWLIIRLYQYVGNFVELPILITDHVFIGYVGYCMWGYYLCRINANRKQKRIIYIIGLLSFVVTNVLPLVTDVDINNSNVSFPRILICIAVFFFFVQHPIQLSPKIGKILEHLSGMTFGIYMVHTFVVIETFTRLHRFIPNVYLLVPAAIVATLVFSYVIILIIKQIPVLKKWVV